MSFKRGFFLYWYEDSQIRGRYLGWSSYNTQTVIGQMNIGCQILTIKMIHIYNVYNSLLTSYVFIDNSFMLSMIEHQLWTDVKHMLIKNFNLYYSLWCNSSRLTQHATTNQLLKLIEMTNSNLILSQNIITWQMKNTTSIIDLMFMLKYLREKLIYCEIKLK